MSVAEALPKQSEQAFRHDGLLIAGVFGQSGAGEVMEAATEPSTLVGEAN